MIWFNWALGLLLVFHDKCFFDTYSMSSMCSHFLMLTILLVFSIYDLLQPHHGISSAMTAENLRYTFDIGHASNVCFFLDHCALIFCHNEVTSVLKGTNETPFLVDWVVGVEMEIPTSVCVCVCE